jgi:hypothetical protein
MKLQNIIKLILGNLLILVIFLLLGEVVMRLKGHKPYNILGNKVDIEVSPKGKYYDTDSLLGYKLYPGEFKLKLKGEYEFTVGHNDLTKRLTSEKKEGEDDAKPEIWILGSSFTYGWAINDDETFPWLLQSNLNDFKVVNWGVSGYGTIHTYLQLKEALKSQKKPSFIIINHSDYHFGVNTFCNANRRALVGWNFLGQVNQPFATLNEDGTLHVEHSKNVYDPWYFSKYSALSYYGSVKYEEYVDKENKLKGIEITRLIFDEIFALCDEHQIKVLLMSMEEGLEFIKDVSAKNNIPFLHNYVDLLKEGNSNIPYDAHPSAKSNKVYAKNLYTYLKNSPLIK